jgi:membrane protein DedA with SNARE-associated domain
MPDLDFETEQMLVNIASIVMFFVGMAIAYWVGYRHGSKQKEQETE